MAVLYFRAGEPRYYVRFLPTDRLAFLQPSLQPFFSSQIPVADFPKVKMGHELIRKISRRAMSP